MPLKAFIDLLGNPELVASLTDADWNPIIQYGRQVEMLGQLAARLEVLNTNTSIPSGVQNALTLAQLKAQRRNESTHWEIKQLRQAIPPSTPIVLLKGSAYISSGDMNAHGRLFSDLDILVPQNDLEKVERELITAGWQPSEMDKYDQIYYRHWMHELPPMENLRRRTVLDIHHAIVPKVSRYAFDPSYLFEAARKIDTGIYVLSTQDRIIHCAVHAFIEGVPTKALRDLYDLANLIHQHIRSPGDWTDLEKRANLLGLRKVLIDATSAAGSIFKLPSIVIPGAPSFRSRILAKASSTADYEHINHLTLSHMLLLAHSHWMKMPLRILIPHLLRKIRLGIKNAPSEERIQG